MHGAWQSMWRSMKTTLHVSPRRPARFPSAPPHAHHAAMRTYTRRARAQAPLRLSLHAGLSDAQALLWHFKGRVAALQVERRSLQHRTLRLQRAHLRHVAVRVLPGHLVGLEPPRWARGGEEGRGVPVRKGRGTRAQALGREGKVLPGHLAGPVLSRWAKGGGGRAMPVSLGRGRRPGTG